MKKSIILSAVLFAIPLMAGNMNISGQKNPAEVTEENGVYTVSPQSRTRIQLYPKSGYTTVYQGAILEVTAEVSGSGNIQLGAHLYNSRRTWSGNVSSRMIRVDAEECETVKAEVTVDKAGIVSVLPLISIYSGTVRVEKLAIRVKGSVDSGNAAAAPVLAGWSHNASKAIRCVLENDILSIITAAGQRVEMLAPFTAAKAGEKISFSGKVSGKGKIFVGLHLYNRRRGWLVLTGQEIAVDGEITAFPVLTVNQPAGKDEVVLVRPVFRVLPGSEVNISGLNAAKAE